jgi:hypothetical protein
MNFKIISSLFIAALLTACDISPKSIKPQSQLDFERQTTAIVKASRDAQMGTRDSEVANDNSNKYWDSLKGKQIIGWKCKYDEIIKWEPAQNIIEEGSPNSKYNLTCRDADAEVGNNFGYSKFSLYIPVANLSNPIKLYRGDVITFNGTINGGLNMGYIPNKNNYELQIKNVSNISFATVK